MDNLSRLAVNLFCSVRLLYRPPFDSSGSSRLPSGTRRSVVGVHALGMRGQKSRLSLRESTPVRGANGDYLPKLFFPRSLDAVNALIGSGTSNVSPRISPFAIPQDSFRQRLKCRTAICNVRRHSGKRIVVKNRPHVYLELCATVISSDKHDAREVTWSIHRFL